MLQKIRLDKDLQQITRGFLSNSDFSESFYERFLAADPAIPAFFENTDFERQRRVLLEALWLVFLEDMGEGDSELAREVERLRALHEHMRLPRRLYAIWRECLVATIGEFIDLSEPSELAWRRCIDALIERVATPHE